MKKSVKLIASVLGITMMSSTVCNAFTFKKEFFTLQEGLDNATAAGDDRGIIYYAEQQYNMVANAAQDSDTTAVAATKTYVAAQAYERLNEYDNAAIWYNRAIPSNEAMGFSDAVRISREKVKQFTTQFNLYQKTYDTQVNFNAKNEPEIGVLTGITFDSPTRSELKNESMMLIYHMHGDDFNLFYEGFLKEAQEKHLAVELAYNVNGAADIGMINMSSQTVSNFADILARYPDVPIYLRFAGEINEWEPKPAAEDYKNAFRTVANIMRSKCPNVAMVYGLNFVSSWDTEYTDYYPGDEYVDWVGVSLYCKKYFWGRPAASFDDTIGEVMFYGGKSAEPVLIMDEIVNTFGNRKPIMIFESGATGHMVETGEYSEDWANRRIAKILNYLPMKYPQIKMIGYFDQYVSPEKDDYSLKNHSSMKAYYNSQVKKSHFIQGRYDNDNVSGYVNCDNGFSVTQSVNGLAVYAGVYGSESERVDYFIDDEWVAGSSEIPYACDIDFSKYPVGAHTLRYNVTDSLGRLYSQSVGFNVTDSIKIKVDGNILAGLDQPPVAINGRTMVPVRAIFEAVGATVSWDGTTQTVTATRGSDVVVMKIGDKNIYKNGALYAQSDVSAKAINGRTLVPARIAAEVFGKTVGWEQSTKTVTVA